MKITQTLVRKNLCNPKKKHPLLAFSLGHMYNSKDFIVLIHLIIIIALCSRHHFYTYYIDDETEAQRGINAGGI